MRGSVNVRLINVRSHPNMYAGKVAQLGRGTVVEILGETKHWYEINYKGYPAFVSKDYVSLEPARSEYKAEVKVSRLNVRETPSLDSKVLGVLKAATLVEVLNIRNRWVEIPFYNDTGFIAQNYIELHRVENTAADEPLKGRVSARRLNVRSAPNRRARVIGVVARNTEIDLIDEIKDWYEITFNGSRAFVARAYVKKLENEHSTGLEEERFADTFSGDGKAIPVIPKSKSLDASVVDNALEPSIALPVEGSAKQKKVASTWNRFGGVISTLSKQKDIDVACAIAVFCVESSGKGFEPSNQGRMIIRFENHKFWRYWGRENKDIFNRHFEYSPQKVWQGHKWRPETDGAWRSFHGRQEREWAVLEFARKLNSDAALMSISMGAPQIMGFHYESLGYRSVEEMFNEFKGSMAAQIEGFFEFLSAAMVQRLQKKDFTGFARLYNGAGQKEKYGQWILEHYKIFKRIS